MRIITVLITVACLIVGITIVNSTISSLPTNATSGAEEAMLGFMPVMLGVVGLAGVFTAITGGSEVVRYIRFRK